jgi:hypothetical protein
VQVTEVHNFTQDDLLTDDVMILDCNNAIYEWVGQNTSTDEKEHVLEVAKVWGFPLILFFLEIEFLNSQFAGFMSSRRHRSKQLYSLESQFEH